MGKRIAWSTRAWTGFDDFLACQRIWDRWAKWFFFVGLVLLSLAAAVIGYLVLGFL